MKPHAHLFIAIILLVFILSDALELFRLRHLPESSLGLRVAIVAFDTASAWFAAFNLCSAIRKLLKP